MFHDGYSYTLLPTSGKLIKGPSQGPVGFAVRTAGFYFITPPINEKTECSLIW